MTRLIGKGVLGSTLIVFAALHYIIGLQHLVAVQTKLLYEPAELLPLMLSIAVPALVFLIGAILAFKGSLSLSYKASR